MSYKNLEKNNDYMRKWRAKNPEKTSSYYKKYKKEWSKRNSHQVRLDNIKSGAKQRNHKWAIPKEIGWALISSPCAYCGQILGNFNGLDRVDNSKEYTVDNVVPCCKYCNQAKNSMSVKEFENHINKIYNYKR